jgi:hypothetical protein
MSLVVYNLSVRMFFKNELCQLCDLSSVCYCN